MSIRKKTKIIYNNPSTPLRSSAKDVEEEKIKKQKIGNYTCFVLY